jgi:hypothetical protein
MTTVRTIYHILRADFLERTRRYSFLITLVGALYLGYAVNAGNIVMHLDGYIGVYNSSWIGTLVALSTLNFVSLVGFYVVKNTIHRDMQTRVGQILASTPISKVSYIVGKFLSNLAILYLIVIIQAIAALVLQLLRSEGLQIDVWKLFSPFLLIALPGLAVTAALAVLFESVRWLRGGVGNILYVFLWSSLIAVSSQSNNRAVDIFSIQLVEGSVKSSIVAVHPEYKGGFSLNAGPRQLFEHFKTFRWDGIEWTSVLMLQRLSWFLYALLLSLLAAIFFDRFDSVRITSRSRSAKKNIAAHENAPSRWKNMIEQVFSFGFIHPRSTFGRMLLAEIRLMFKGVSLWWYALVITCIVLSLTVPVDDVKEYVLPIAWLLPALLWSGIGTREARYGTDQLLFSAPSILRRQFPALWLSGVVLALVVGSGAIIRFAMLGDVQSIFGVAVAVLFIPSLALAIGVWSKGRKAFEAVYTMLWYIGPMNHVRELDFTGVATSPPAVVKLCFLFLTVVALGVAFIGRKRQIIF